MTRGSWKLSVWAAGGQVACSSLLTLNKLRPDDGWDAASFWDEEEARRADWDRRGRQL